MLNDPLTLALARLRNFFKRNHQPVTLHIYKHIHPTYFSIPSIRIQRVLFQIETIDKAIESQKSPLPLGFCFERRTGNIRVFCRTPLLYLPRWKCGNKGTRNVEYFSTIIPSLSFEFKGRLWRTGNEPATEIRLIVSRLLIKFPNELFFNYLITWWFTLNVSPWNHSKWKNSNPRLERKQKNNDGQQQATRPMQFCKTINTFAIYNTKHLP